MLENDYGGKALGAKVCYIDGDEHIMTKDPMKLIEQYLERVKIYLPLDSADILVEIRTHLIEAAETIGEGRITIGSTLMAIERFGEPKAVANEYAGSGKRVGPVPTEYTQPILRILGALIALSVAFAFGSYIVGTALLVPLGIVGEAVNIPSILPVIMIANFLFIFFIIGTITVFEKRNRDPSEKSVLEEFLGIGSEGFKPKPKSDAAADLFFGVLLGIVLLLPQVMVLYSTEFRIFIGIAAALLFIGAMKGVLFLVGGENNANLLFEIGEGIFNIIFVMFLLNVRFPVDYIWINTDGMWRLLEIWPLFERIDYPFSLIPTLAWRFVLFIVVVVTTWRIIVNAMKVSMYTKEGRGFWWQGTWGPSKIRFPKITKTENSHVTRSDIEREAVRDFYDPTSFDDPKFPPNHKDEPRGKEFREYGLEERRYGAYVSRSQRQQQSPFTHPSHVPPPPPSRVEESFQDDELMDLLNEDDWEQTQ
jgi:hypothetical protein